MLGMLQIVILLGCIYLVVKVISIYQTGLAAAPENRRQAAIFAGLALVIGLGGAGLCFKLMLDQSMSVSDISSPY